MIPLIVDLEPEWRGGQNQAFLLLKGLLDRGHAAELVAAKGSALGERAPAIGVCVHSVSRRWLRLGAARRIRALLQGGRFDLVHANEPHAATSAWLARVHKQAPLIISRRVGYPLGRTRLARARYQAAAKIVAISRWSAERAAASGAPADKLTVVHEGVEIPPLPTMEERMQARARWGIPRDAHLLGCVGVLLPDKGQEWLIRALAPLRRDFPQCRLFLAGEGPCRPQLEALAQELGVKDAVLFAGFVNDVGSVCAALDAFLFPSSFEALGNALMSAMAYGIPSVAFDQGGPAEIIQDGQNGILVTVANVDEIRSAVSRLLSDTAFARTLGQQGRKRIEANFSADKMVSGMIRVYEEVLRERRPD